MSVRFRLAVIDDVPALIWLAEQWLCPLWEPRIKEEILRTIIRSAEKTGWTQHIIYVAELDDRIVGFIDFLQWQDWLTNQNKVMIQHVYMDENYRHRGIGTMLITHILGIYKPDFAFVDTKPDKFPNAQSLYEKVGLKENPRRIWLERYR